MAEFSPKKRALIHQMKEDGMKQIDISRVLGISPSGVCRTLKRFKNIAVNAFTPDFKSKKRSGRPSKISPQMSRRIERCVNKSPNISSSDVLTDLGWKEQLAPRTIRHHCQKKLGLRAYKPAKKPLLSAKNLRDRLKFCHKYKNWTVDQWKQVMFSDEVKIVQFCGTKQFVRRPKNQRYNPKYITSTVKNPPSVMMWGCIASKGRGGLWIMPKGTTITSKVYLDILKDKL